MIVFNVYDHRTALCMIVFFSRLNMISAPYCAWSCLCKYKLRAHDVWLRRSHRLVAQDNIHRVELNKRKINHLTWSHTFDGCLILLIWSLRDWLNCVIDWLNGNTKRPSQATGLGRISYWLRRPLTYTNPARGYQPYSAGFRLLWLFLDLQIVVHWPEHFLYCIIFTICDCIQDSRHHNGWA